jgi:hypothetical protein
VREKMFAWATVYFKREFMRGRRYDPRVAPLQFAAIPEPAPDEPAERRGVFHSWQDNHPVRTWARLALAEMGFPAAPRAGKAAYNAGLAGCLGEQPGCFVAGIQRQGTISRPIASVLDFLNPYLRVIRYFKNRSSQSHKYPPEFFF